jgi:hypothetical protein
MPRCRFLWCRKIHFPKSIRVPFDLGNLIKMGLSQRVSEVVILWDKNWLGAIFFVLGRTVVRWRAKLFRRGKKAGNPNKKNIHMH